MSTSHDIYVNGHLTGKEVTTDHTDGSSTTVVEDVHYRDIFGVDAATITQVIETDKNGNVNIKDR